MKRNVIATAVAVVAVVAVAFFAGVNVTTQRASTVTVTTFASTVLQPGGFVTEEVIVQPVSYNDICITGTTTTTSTAYLLAADQNSTVGVTSSTTTITLNAVHTTTIYENATIYANSQFVCTLINPHYHVTQTSTSSNCTCV